MNFELSEAERALQQKAQEVAARELAPRSAQVDAEKKFPSENLDCLAALGWLGVLVPEAYGGAQLGNLNLCLILEEVNRACAATGVTCSVHNSLVCGSTARFGTELLKQKYLPRLARGNLLGAYALTEPNAGSDAASIATRAVRDGGDYVLNGSKLFITTGANAGLFVLFARTDPDPKARARGITAFLMEKETPGLRTGKPEAKLGIRGSTTVELFLEDCRVPVENRLGEEGQGFKVAMHTLDGGRIGIATQALGIARACLEASVAFVKPRKSLARSQAIQWKLAQMATSIEAARLLIHRAARMRDADVPHTPQAAQAKLFASRLCNRVAAEAMQLHAEAGYLRDLPVERYFRDARITELYEGTTEIQHLVIARSLLEDA